MSDSGSRGRPEFRKPVPEGVIEASGVTVGEATALVPLSDGELGLLASGRLLRSDDGGVTWGEPLELDLPRRGQDAWFRLHQAAVRTARPALRGRAGTLPADAVGGRRPHVAANTPSSTRWAGRITTR